MFAYILRRLALIPLTLLGIITLNFLIVQVAPGGPVERVLAEIRGLDVGATDTFSGGGSDTARSGASGVTSSYRGAQGLDPDFIKDIERQFGFDKPAHERFILMVTNYIKFDLGESFYRSIDVGDLIIERCPFQSRSVCGLRLLFIWYPFHWVFLKLCETGHALTSPPPTWWLSATPFLVSCSQYC